MTPQALEYIKDRLEQAGLNYHFARYNYDGTPVYPYHVGTYSERDAVTEDGQQETTFTINSWTRGTWLDLERDKAIIKSLFPVVGGATAILDGSGVAVSYVRSYGVPTGDDELKRMETILTVNEWSV